VLSFIADDAVITTKNQEVYKFSLCTTQGKKALTLTMTLALAMALALH